MMLFYLLGCLVNMIILTVEVENLKENYSVKILLLAMIIYVSLSWLVVACYIYDYIYKRGK